MTKRYLAAATLDNKTRMIVRSDEKIGFAVGDEISIKRLCCKEDLFMRVIAVYPKNVRRKK